MTDHSSPVIAGPRNPRALLALFVAAIFTSALLLFAVQPLFTRMVLPRFGGSPGVWSVAMAFFQTLLLAGYLYAHLLMKAKDRRVPVMVHLAVLVFALLSLPLSIAAGWGEPPSQNTALWLIGLFAVSIGLPFFALAANNPLLQAWFSRTGHPASGDPYFLYAASNIGSFLALLAYPFAIEPLLPLGAQNALWTAGYAVLVALIAVCGVVLWRARVETEPLHARLDAGHAVPPERVEAPTTLQWLRWAFLAAVPSGLLVAVTAHISTDIAAAPLLWVIPLALYLLTWVIVFQSRPLMPHGVAVLLAPVAIALLLIALTAAHAQYTVATLGVHLLAFFIIAMAAHGELARTRPHPLFLTSFYVALSFGGMIGGLFAGLLAPQLFSSIAEYPLLICLAALTLPPRHVIEAMGIDRGIPVRRDGWMILGIAAAILLAKPFTPPQLTTVLAQNRLAIVAVLAVGIVLLRADRLKVAAAAAIASGFLTLYPADSGRVHTVRSFFGVHKILTTDDGMYNVLMHGTTIHGAQKIRNADGTLISGRPEPITYYHKDGGIGRAITALRARKGAPLKVAAIGLGTGTLACHIENGESWRFFEIDPKIVEIARDPQHFSYLARCAPDLAPVMGDARLTFAREPDGLYDLIIVDAYSSDAIPVHLATKEAMEMYRQKLAPQGAVLMHVSNRNLDLEGVAVGIAAANGLKSWVYYEDSGRNSEYIYGTDVVVSARDAVDVGTLAADDYWTLTAPDAAERVWTDDYSNIIGALLRKHESE